MQEFLIIVSLLVGYGSSIPVKLCVTPSLKDACAEMEADMPETWKCVLGRDKLHCAQMLKDNEADLCNMNERALYLAGKFFDCTPIASEVIDGRTHKYAGIALVSKSSNITTPSDLRGRRSCHTGVGRTVGWHLPLASLLSTGVMPLDCASSELKVVSDFFSGGSCAPGNWSADPLIDRELKRQHPGLCSRCKTSCNSSDEYAGYQGSVRCLVDSSGDVAFTKMSVVREMLKNDPNLGDEIDLLCLEGGRKPLTPDGEICTWGYRPSNAYVTSSENKSVNEDVLWNALNATETRYTPENAPDWFYTLFLSGKKVTGLQRTTSEKANYQNYLGSFLNVIEKRENCAEVKKKICAVSEVEHLKCQDYSRAMVAQGLFPRVDCVEADSKVACMQIIKDGHADIVALDGGDIYKAGRYFDMQPVSAEVYGSTEVSYYAVAIIRSASDVRRLSELRGLRSCHTGIGRTAGWVVPIGALLEKGDIPDNQCDRAEAVGEFFSAGSCVPGANNTKYNPERSQAESLCRQCIGDQNGKNKCSRDNKERYSGYAGAFRCLADGQGEVAFVKHTTAAQYTDGRASDQLWSRDLLSSDFQLLCRRGGTAPVESFLDCNLAKVPSHYVMTSGAASRSDRLDLARLLADSAKYFGDDSELFKLLHQYRADAADAIFKDSTTSLKATPLKSSYVDVLGQEFYKACEAVDPKACT